MLEYTWLIDDTECLCIKVSIVLDSPQVWILWCHTVLCSLYISSPMDGSIFGCFLIFLFFFSASCVSLVLKIPPTALILDVPSGESSLLLPQDPSPSADVTGVTLKAPQVGHLSSVLFLNHGSQSVALTKSICITWELGKNAGLRAYPRTTELETLEVGSRTMCLNKFSKEFACLWSLRASALNCGESQIWGICLILSMTSPPLCPLSFLYLCLHSHMAVFMACFVTLHIFMGCCYLT